MKKFFCILPLQTPSLYLYEQVGNEKLQLNVQVPFPILTAISGYADKGEEIRVVAVVTDNKDAKNNISVFDRHLREICDEKGIICSNGLETILIEDDEKVATKVSVFQKVIEYTDDNDELFACITYGTKPTSMALMSAMKYAYNVQSNVTVECIVYGQIDRSLGKDPSLWSAKVYDMTALIQLDEIIHTLGKLKVKDPKNMIDSILLL